MPIQAYKPRKCCTKIKPGIIASKLLCLTKCGTVFVDEDFGDVSVLHDEQVFPVLDRPDVGPVGVGPTPAFVQGHLRNSESHLVGITDVVDVWFGQAT